MGLALYRKYRSRSLDEVVGQDHIKNTLIKALKNGKLSHAYLFTGPRGVGKTSVARILAYEANNIPYESESIHLDIIEIDAASNRRIDEIRDLREKINITPTTAKYKIYIIDEVHMLTKEAFNALLKTLEEPPAHVIFILATTEAHKVPETIVSRTQRFVFKPISENDIAGHLKSIVKKEGINISDEAIDLLSRHAEGSFRDSLSLLDQLSAYSSKVDSDDVRQSLGIPPTDLIERLHSSLEDDNKAAVIEILDELKRNGVAAVATAKKLSELLRNLIINGGTGEWEVKLLKDLLLVPSSPSPDEYLEISLLTAVTSVNPQIKKSLKKRDAASLHEIVNLEKEQRSKDTSSKKQVKFKIENWPEIINNVGLVESSLSAVLRQAKPVLQDEKLTLNFQFTLHEKKARLVKNADILRSVIFDMYGQKLNIEYKVDKTFIYDKADVLPKSSPNSDPINAINSIFGSAKVLESQ